MTIQRFSGITASCVHLRVHFKCLFWLFMLLVVVGTGMAQQVQVTGLRPPTQAETAWMDKSMVKTVRVRPNSLGLERINRQRRDKGLAGIQVNVAAVGEESLVTPQPGMPPGIDLSSADSGMVTSVGAAALPSAVDNSSLPSFPPIRNQDSLGSCAAFSTTYYVGTHMLGLARGSNNKNNLDNTRKLSPKWTYNLVNGGMDTGSWFSTIMDVMMKLGCPSWADFPYTGSPTPAANYLEWSRDPAVWRSAIANRFQQIGRVQAVDTGAGLDNFKALLANGYALLFATDVYGWQYTQISDDPSTAADNAMVGRNVCWMVASDSSGHAMTIVGYNDDIWIDINKNGQVDAGEKGALKIVNSWGNRWNGANTGNGDGSTWIAYDALRQSSGVSGTSNANRATGYRSAFWGSEVYWITARANYTPTLLGQFTLSHARRDQLNLRVGASSTSTMTPQNYFPATTLFGWQNGADGSWPQAFRSLGGAWSFEGTSAQTSGTIVLDLTDIAQSGSQRYYVSVQDTAGGSPATLSDFRLTTPSGAVLATASSSLPQTADNSTALAYADFSTGAIPVISGPSTASGAVGQAISSLTVSASNGPTSFGATSLPPGLSINTTTGIITGTPTQAGSYAVSLSAANANGVGVGILTYTINSQQISAPIITSSVAVSGTVGQTFNYAITASNAPTSFGANGLPEGLIVNTTTGSITGTPTQAGSFNATVIAYNAGGAGSRGLTITVSAPSVQVPVITSVNTASGLSGSAFSYRLQATNSPTSFNAINLPSGLEFNTTTGVITGTLPGAAQYSITLVATNSAGSGYLFLTLTVTGNNIYGPPNDDFVNPIILSTLSATSSGSNIGADTESGEPAHAGGTARSSVWWRWTAPSSGSVTIQTGGSDFDTRLAVYTGATVSALTQVAANDDSLPNGASQVTFDVLIGTTYQIAVDGYNGATGQIAIGLSHTPSNGVVNDAFASRTTIPGNSASIRAGNLDTTSESGEPAHAGITARRSVWWSWTAPSGGTATIDTIGSDFDTVLGIYTGSGVNLLSQVAANDDGGGNSTSKVTFAVISGTTYQIAVDGYNGATGSIQLNLAFQSSFGAPGNDNFANRTLISGSSAALSSANTNATAETDEPLHDGEIPRRSVWWTWTAPATGTVTLNTSGSAFDTVLAVYLGSTVSDLSGVTSNDDSSGSTTSAVSFSAVIGNSYQIAVDGYGGASGNISMNLNLQVNPANDNFANRVVLSGSDTGDSGSNINATAETSEPAHAGNTASRSVWWSWTAPANGAVTISTDGSNFDTVMAVYRGTALSGLVQVVANDDQSSGNTSAAGFYAVAGTVYQIAVDGYTGRQGLIVLGISQTSSSILYSTDFEDFPIGLGMINGYDGWIATDDTNTGSYGILDFGGNHAAWVGFNSTPSEQVFVYRPMGFDPADTDTPVIRFGVDITIMDSDNSKYDQFGFRLFNTEDDFLAGIQFDNQSMKIYHDDGSGTLTNSGRSFVNGTTYRLEVTMDFAANLWSSTIDGVSLFSSQVMHSGIHALSFGDMDAVWQITTPSDPGNNFMVFDNYRIETDTATESRVIALTGNLDFGPIAIGSSVQQTLTIANTGTSVLTISGIQYPAGFSGNWSGGTITAGNSREVDVTFSPIAAANYVGTITVNSDKTAGDSTISLSGTGVAVDPYDLTFDGTPYDLRVGNQVTFNLNRLLADGETLKVSGKIPSGLKFNATTGLLSGTISGKPGTYLTSVQILQGKTVVRTIVLTITVLEFPPSLIGNFDFLMEDADSIPIGVCKITITSANQWSATLESAGATKKRSAKGTFILAEGEPIAPITAAFPAIAASSSTAGVLAVTVNLSIDGSTPMITGTYDGGTYDGGTLRGFRVAKVGETPPATVAYNLVLDAGKQDGIGIPAGMGWMKGKVSNKGIGTFKGLLGDGAAASFTLRLSAFGQSVLWSQPYKNKSSYIGGIVTLGNLGQTTPGETPLEDEVWWTKAADVKTLSYANGFPGMSITVGTSHWTVPTNATALGSALGWRDSRTAKVSMDGAGLNTQESQSTTAALPTEFTIDDKFNLITSAPTTAPLVAWTGKASNKDGGISGALKLPIGFNIDIPGGTASVTGVLVQDESWGTMTGCGLIKVPASGPKGSFRTSAFKLGQ